MTRNERFGLSVKKFYGLVHMIDSKILENDGYGIYLATEKSSLPQGVDLDQRPLGSPCGNAFDQVEPIAIATPVSDFLVPGIGDEEIVHIPRLFDCLLNYLMVFRCDIHQNSLDGIRSQDYHLELIGGSMKHNQGSLLHLKLAEVTSASLYQVESKVCVSNFMMSCVDFQGQFMC